MRLRSVLLLVTAIGFVASLPACLCGRMKERLAEKATEAAFEAAADDGQGGKAKLDLKKGTISFDDGKGGGMKFQAGGDAKLPDTWPKDFPAVPGGKVTFTAATEKGATVIFEATDPPAKVLAFYAATMKAQGWKIGVKTEAEEGGMILMTKDPKRSATVTVGSSSGKTTVTLSSATGE